MHFWRPFNRKKGNFRVFFGIKSQIFSKMDDIDHLVNLIKFHSRAIYTVRN